MTIHASAHQHAAHAHHAKHASGSARAQEASVAADTDHDGDKK